MSTFTAHLRLHLPAAPPTPHPASLSKGRNHPHTGTVGDLGSGAAGCPGYELEFWGWTQTPSRHAWFLILPSFLPERLTSAPARSRCEAIVVVRSPQLSPGPPGESCGADTNTSSPRVQARLHPSAPSKTILPTCLLHLPSAAGAQAFPGPFAYSFLPLPSFGFCSAAFPPSDSLASATCFPGLMPRLFLGSASAPPPSPAPCQPPTSLAPLSSSIFRLNLCFWIFPAIPVQLQPNPGMALLVMEPRSDLGFIKNGGTKLRGEKSYQMPKISCQTGKDLSRKNFASSFPALVVCLQLGRMVRAACTLNQRLSQDYT